MSAENVEEKTTRILTARSQLPPIKRNIRHNCRNRRLHSEPFSPPMSAMAILRQFRGSARRLSLRSPLYPASVLIFPSKQGANSMKLTYAIKFVADMDRARCVLSGYAGPSTEILVAGLE